MLFTKRNNTAIRKTIIFVIRFTIPMSLPNKLRQQYELDTAISKLLPNILLPVLVRCCLLLFRCCTLSIYQKQIYFKFLLASVTFALNLSLRITRLETHRLCDSFFNEQAASTIDLAMSSGLLLLFKSFVAICNIKCSGFSVRFL